jgi:hypothetical protein
LAALSRPLGWALPQTFFSKLTPETVDLVHQCDAIPQSAVEAQYLGEYLARKTLATHLHVSYTIR